MADTSWKPLLASGMVGLAALVSAVGLSWVRGIPVPMVHDEFAYLLQADTFAHGRLANPPHPMAEFFDTFHVLQEPTYAAKYPPAQALFLALGQKVWHPVVGVWLSFGLLGAALTWMLRAWVPLPWAVIGSLVTMSRLLGESSINEWAYGYWGGSVAALGGCLVWGAGRRLYDQPKVSHSLVYGLGLFLLASCRPAEGFLTALPITLVLLWRYAGPGSGRTGPDRAQGMLPAVLVLVLAGFWLGAYNHAVTGCWYRMPYQVHYQKNMGVPLLLWQEAPREPEFEDAFMKKFYIGWDKEVWKTIRSDWQNEIRDRLQTVYHTNLGLFWVPFWLVGAFRRDIWSLLILGTEALVIAFLLQSTWFRPHYLAPVICLPACQISRGVQWFCEQKGRVGLLYKLMACVAIGTGLTFGGMAFTSGPEPHKLQWARDRDRLLQSLLKQGGKHLVLVRYDEDHDVHQEWVYNGADLENAPVIWARDKGHPRVLNLLSHYPDRKVWVVEPDRERVLLPRREAN